jgi:ribosomal protein S17E
MAEQISAEFVTGYITELTNKTERNPSSEASTHSASQ